MNLQIVRAMKYTGFIWLIRAIMILWLVGLAKVVSSLTLTLRVTHNYAGCVTGRKDAAVLG